MGKSMHRSAMLLSVALACLAPGALGGEAQESEADRKVREGILAFRKEMASDDEKVRTAAFDRVLPDKALVEKLLGKASEALWPKMEAELKAMRQRTGDLKRELDGRGAIKGVKVSDVRKDDPGGRMTPWPAG